MNNDKEFLNGGIVPVKKRRNPWNVLLVGLTVLLVLILFASSIKAASVFLAVRVPADAMFRSYTRIGTILLFSPLFIVFMMLGIALSYFIVRLLPAARKAYERQTRIYKGGMAGHSVKYYFALSAVLMMVASPLVLFGAQDYFYVTAKGVVYNSMFKEKHYGWGDIERVYIKCVFPRDEKQKRINLNYILCFKDGKELDLWEDNKESFLQVYNKIFSYLRTNPAIIYNRGFSASALNALTRFWDQETCERILAVLKMEFIQ